MRLSRTEWIAVLFVIATIAGFGGWLQSEMNRAARVRAERETVDPHGRCGGMNAQDARRIDQGAIWCGAIDAS